MQCPRCGLENLPETLDCECGWEAVVVPATTLAGHDEFDADDPVSGYTWGLVPHSPWRRRLARLALYGPAAACLAMVLFQILTNDILYTESHRPNFFSSSYFYFSPDLLLPLAYGSHLVILMAIFYLLPGRALCTVPWPLQPENRPWLRQMGVGGLRALWVANTPGLVGLMLLALTHGLVLLAQWLILCHLLPVDLPVDELNHLQTYLLRSACLAVLLVFTACYESTQRVLHPHPCWRLVTILIFLFIGFCPDLLSLYHRNPFDILDDPFYFFIKGFFSLFMFLFVCRAWRQAGRRLETEIMTPAAFNARPTPPTADWPAWLTRANPVFRLTTGLEPRSHRRIIKALIALVSPSVAMVLISKVIWHNPEMFNIYSGGTKRYCLSIFYATALIALPIIFRRILVSTPAMLRHESRDELRMANLGGYARLWGTFAPSLGGAGLLLLVETALLAREFCDNVILEFKNGDSLAELWSHLDFTPAILLTCLLPATLTLFSIFYDAALRGLNRSYIVRVFETTLYCTVLFGMVIITLIGLHSHDLLDDILGITFEEDLQFFASSLTVIWLAIWLVITAWRRAARRLEEAE